MIEPFLIGTGNRQVFATYHPPADGAARVLTVICPPLFCEYMRTQLMLRELALSLAGKGQHVLRFDYRGTGDSCGELSEVTVSDWVEDIGLVIREGLELTGATQVQLVGVRAGALLACKAAAARADVERVVLWDPVADGIGYLEELRRVQQGILARNPFLSRADRREGMHEFAGYRLPGPMLEEFRLLDARTYAGVPIHKLHVLATSPGNDFPVPDVDRALAPFQCDWETDVEAQILIRPVLEGLASCLTTS